MKKSIHTENTQRHNIRRDDGFYLTFFFFFWYQKVYLSLHILVGGEGCANYCQLILILPNLSPFPITCSGVLLSLGDPFWRRVMHCALGTEGMWESAPENYWHPLSTLKFKFTGFASLARRFLVVELTFLFAGIKVSGS